MGGYGPGWMGPGMMNGYGPGGGYGPGMMAWGGFYGPVPAGGERRSSRPTSISPSIR